ncbi:hypothetical protein [Streptomyces sp. NPDC056527]|uniref:hypothetical protein n=1 Tax=Streptomyces sp. NPDC056527 TaxID=3345853 RepID=UPI0036C28E15
MSDLLERPRGRGRRTTSQRRIVAEVLEGDHVHPTGDPLAGLPTEDRFGFRVSEVEVTHRGLCPDGAAGPH